MASRWSLAIFSLILSLCRAIPAPTFSHLQSSREPFLHTSSIGKFPTPEGSHLQGSMQSRPSGASLRASASGTSPSIHNVTKQTLSLLRAGNPHSKDIKSSPAVVQSTGSQFGKKTSNTQTVKQGFGSAQSRARSLQDSGNFTLSNSAGQLRSMLTNMGSALPKITTKTIVSQSSTISPAITIQRSFSNELSPIPPESIASGAIATVLQSTTGSQNPPVLGHVGSPVPIHVNSSKPSSSSTSKPLLSGVFNPSTPHSSSAAQSSTPPPTTTETTLPPEASLQTLSSGAYLSDQWITTTPPGSSSATVVPVIIPPELNDPIVLWNVLPGPPPGGEFPTLPHLEINAPKAPCIRIFGMSIGSCPSKHKGQNSPPEPNPNSDPNPDPKPNSAPTQEPSRSESRSSEASSSTCTSSMATVTSISCASIGISSSCTTAYATKSGCEVNGSLTSTASCVSQTTINGKTFCCPSMTVIRGSTLCALPSLTVEDVMVAGTVPQKSVGSVELMDQLRSYVAMQSGSLLASGASQSLPQTMPSSGFTASAPSPAANSRLLHTLGSASPGSQPIASLPSVSSTVPTPSLFVPFPMPSASSSALPSLNIPSSSKMRPSETQDASMTTSISLSAALSQPASTFRSASAPWSGSSLPTASQFSGSTLSAGTAVSSSNNAISAFSSPASSGTASSVSPSSASSDTTISASSSSSGIAISASPTSGSGHFTGFSEGILSASSTQPLITSVSPTNVPGVNGLDSCVLRMVGDPSNPGFCSGTDYCECGSVGVAPSLSPTVTTSAGTTVTTLVPVCTQISIQPTADSCPPNTNTMAPASSVAAASASAASVFAAYVSSSQSVAAQPTASAQCFPYHDINVLQDSKPDMGLFCASTNYTLQDGTIWDPSSGAPASPNYGSTVDDPASAINNNNILAGFTIAPDASPRCQDLFYPGSPTLATLACSAALEQIVRDCPFNGGRVSNACGEWWLMTCPWNFIVL